jgi:hypothetical protein
MKCEKTLYMYKNRVEVLAVGVELMLLYIHKYVAKQQTCNAECVELFVTNFIITV